MNIINEIKNLSNLGYDYFKDNGKPCICFILKENYGI